MSDLTVQCEALIAAANLEREKRGAAAFVPQAHAPIMAGVCTALGVSPGGGMLADWHMLCAKGEFDSCQQPADYQRVWLRLKMQQVG